MTARVETRGLETGCDVAALQASEMGDRSTNARLPTVVRYVAYAATGRTGLIPVALANVNRGRSRMRLMLDEALLLAIASIAAVIAGFTAVTAALAPPGGSWSRSTVSGSARSSRPAST